MIATLARFNREHTTNFPVPSQRFLTYAFLLLISSMCLGPHYYVVSHPASLVQLVNLNQHVVWESPFTGELRFIRISSEGKTIAFVTGSEPSTLSVMDGANGELLWEFTPTGLAHYNGTITCLGLSADGEYMAIGTTGGNVYLFHRSGPEIIQHWQTPSPIITLAVSGVGTFIAIAYANLIYFLSRLERTPLWSENMTSPAYFIANMSASRSGSALVVSATDRRLSVYQTGTGQLYSTKFLNRTTRDLQFNAAGTQFFMATESYGILYRAEGPRLQEYPITPNVFALSGEGENIALAPNDTVHVFDLESPPLVANRSFDSSVSSLSFTFDGTFLLVGTIRGTLYATNPANFDVFWTLTLNEPIMKLLTPDVGDFFLAATTTRLIAGRIFSITGLITFLAPLILVIFTSVGAGILTIWLIRPRRSPKLITDEKDE